MNLKQIDTVLYCKKDSLKTDEIFIQLPNGELTEISITTIIDGKLVLKPAVSSKDTAL